MDNKPKKKIRFSISWMYLAMILFLAGMYFLDNDSLVKTIDITEFERYVRQNAVSDITVYRNNGKVEAEINDSLAQKLFGSQYKKDMKAKVVSEVASADKMQDKLDQWQQEGVYKGNYRFDQGNDYSSWFWNLVPFLALIVFWIWMMRRMSGRGDGAGGGIFGVGKSKAKIFDKDNAVKVTFDDVAGLAEAKVEIEEIVEFLRHPKRYTDLGGKIPKGALLVGPPGTGKTLLAKAVAGEANVPFFSMSGSDFVEMFVGVGASRVRDLFAKAKEKAPCIVFIDEIDAVGRARGRNASMGGNDERENTLNQLLTEMDGFGTNSGVIILAATNRADILDKALLRAGRFDRQIYVELPELNDRVDIFKVHLRNVKISPDVDVNLLARQTPGFSGADIANVCNEAALIAARNNKKVVDPEDFSNAVDRIIGGLEKKSKITTDEEKRAIAVHESGHATASWHLQYANPLIKVTIVPRGKALGAAWYLPEERQITPKQALLDELCSLLAGRAAEEVFLGSISTGAANDLERATKQAYAMVVYFGMSDRLPNVSYYDSTGQAYGFTKPFSEERAKLIDEEVSKIIEEQYDRAKQILLKYADGHHALSELLISREVIFTEDAERIFGPRPWASRTDEILASSAKEAKTDDDAKSSASGSSGDKADGTSGSDDFPDDMPPFISGE